MAHDKRFCNICDNVTILTTMNEEIVFICVACKKYTKGDDDDTLIKTYVSVDKEDIDKFLANNCRYDNLNPLEERPCPECKKTNYMSYIRSIETLKKIYICKECDYIETT